MPALMERLMAAAYDPLLGRAEAGALGAVRAGLLADVAGHVVVVGAGTGADLPHLPPAVTRVTLVEPSGPMRERLREKVPAHLADRTEVVHGFGEQLPLDAGSVDHAVTSLVLCSVRRPADVVAELDRVVRPGGDVRVLEHGVAQGPVGQRAQRLAEPTWKVLAGGCHLTRDAAAELGDRFDVGALRRVDVPFLRRIGSVVAGTATP